MWTVVHFIKENSVEAVPSHWVKKTTCAWPKNEIKKHIHRRIIVNKYNFDYFPSRILKKGIGTLQEAKLKVRMAENTSDLSTGEDVQNKTRRRKLKVEDAPIFTSSINTDVLSSSLCDYPKPNVSHKISSPCSTLEVKKKLFDATSSTFSQKDFLISSYNDKQKYNTQTLSSTVTGLSDELYDYRTIDVPTGNHDYDKLEVSNSQDFFDFKNDSSLDSNGSIEMQKQNSTVVHTISSPFKVAMLDSTQVETTAALNPLKHKGSDIKMSLVDNSSAIFTPSSSFRGSLNRNCTTNTIPDVSDSNDTLKKILSVVLKIKYDIENLTHNQNRMDSILNDIVLTNEKSVSNQKGSITTNDDNDYSLMLPLHNEDELSKFENKLLNKSFRLNVVNGLKRLVKNSLTSTIRQMLRYIFDDEVLQLFSYVGQKKKKIFPSLASCAIIFEAVRSMKRFQDIPNADIEMPIKIYIAGAAFRKKKYNNL